MAPSVIEHYSSFLELVNRHRENATETVSQAIVVYIQNDAILGRKIPFTTASTPVYKL
jgi:hypothetical protein